MSKKFNNSEDDELCRVMELADNEYLGDLYQECEFVQNYLLGIRDPDATGVKKRFRTIKFSPDQNAGKWARERLEYYRQRRQRLRSSVAPRASQEEKEINCVRRFFQNEGQDLSFWKVSKHFKQDDDIDVVARSASSREKKVFLFQIRELDGKYAGEMGKWGIGLTGGTPESFVKLAYLAIEDKLLKCQTKNLILLFDWNVSPPDEYVAQMERKFRVLKFRKLIKKFLGVYIVCGNRNIKIKSWEKV